MVSLSPINFSDGQKPARLLVCDDSTVERLALAHLLRREGFEVDEAGDGQSAIAQLKHREINAVLLDLNMPDVDGFGVLRYVQEHRRSLPVILLSGMPLESIQHKIHNLPDRSLPPLLLKPIDPEQLLSLLELQLSGELPASGIEETSSED
jgi:CheY-like chemotaxis protein